MNRKDFFKKIGLTSVAIAFTPSILLNAVKNSPKIGDIDIPKWFQENKYWLLKWLDNYEEVKIPLKEIRETMQIFTVKVPSSQLPRFNEYYDRHKNEILLSAVFSKPSHYFSSYQGMLSYMNGFLNQTGRLPTKDDKVIFEVCPPDTQGRRFLRMTPCNPYEEEYRILSDCRLKIIN